MEKINAYGYRAGPAVILRFFALYDRVDHIFYSVGDHLVSRTGVVHGELLGFSSEGAKRPFFVRVKHKDGSIKQYAAGLFNLHVVEVNFK